MNTERRQIAAKGRNWTVLATHEEPHQFPVYLLSSGKTLAVMYGAEFTSYALHEDLAASREYGHCVRHALECNGMLEG